MPTINLDRILETLRKAVTRADVFMGIGLNAAEHSPPLSHVLASDGGFSMQLVKLELNEQEKAQAAIEFSKWIRTSGLRELLESLSIFMDQTYLAIFHLLLGGQSSKGPLKLPMNFARLGIHDKIIKLSATIDISDADIATIGSLNRVRNCFAHRLGIVGKPDVGTGSTLRVTWRTLEMTAREPDGTLVAGDDLFNRRFDHGATIGVRTISRTKDFEMNNQVVLEKQELKEICLCVLTIGEQLVKSVRELAESRGQLVVLQSNEASDDAPAQQGRHPTSNALDGASS